MDDAIVKKARELAAEALLEWDQKLAAKDWKIEKDSVSKSLVLQYHYVNIHIMEIKFLPGHRSRSVISVRRKLLIIFFAY